MDEGTANGHTGSVLTSWAPFWLPRSGARLWGQLLGRKTTQIGPKSPKSPQSSRVPSDPRHPRGKLLVLAGPGGRRGVESFIISITLIFDRVVCLKGDCNHFKFISRL